jgi:hypothetical protein
MLTTRHLHAALTVMSCLALGTMNASASVLLNDTFADGSRAETSLPNESAVWVSHASGVTMGAGSLQFDQTASSGSQKMWTHFAADGSPVSLAVGDQLIATIEFTPRNTLYDISNRSFRFGLFNDPTDPQVAADLNSDGGGSGSPWTDATGYGVQIALSLGTTASTAANVGKRTDQANSSLMGSSGAWTFTNSGNPIVNTLDTLYTATLSLNRLAVNQMQVTFAIADAGGVISTHTILDDPTGTGEFGTDPVATDFDQLFFRWSNNTQTADLFDFSRLSVEYIAIPEPATLSLLGLGGLALFLRRRRA